VTGAGRVVVAGNGMAGFRFVQELLALNTGADITVIGDEAGGAYNRAQLPLVLAGAVREDSIELADRGWYAARGVRLVTGTARRIDRVRRVVETAEGVAVPYHVLVLALGSAPVMPPAGRLTGPGGRLLPGAVAFRTLEDCAEIRALADGARHAVVLGGGVLGLETARGLAADGLPVTLVQRGPRLMERQLDAPAARVLARTVRALGIAVRAGVSVSQVRGAGRVTGIEFDDDTALDADLLVLCCGARPRTELARRAGLAADAGVVVGDELRSVTDPRVFAIGDCAEHRGRTHGLVAPAWAQATAAARAVAGLGPVGVGAAGVGPAGYGSAGHAAAGGTSGDPVPPAVIRLKAAGIELAVLGSAHGAGADVTRFTDPARGIYQKLVVRDGRLAGAILLGDTRAAGTLTQLFDRGAALPADLVSLLAGRRDGVAAVADSPVMMPADTTVCQCNGVTKAAICDAWQDGARDAGQVAARTRACTGCGTCRAAVDGIVAWLAAAKPGLVPA
jgi:assimilatory nitrate reductase electron transfer subunit